MRFKVGDRVRVRTWESLYAEFGSPYDRDRLIIRCGFDYEMRLMCGRVYTIASVNTENETYSLVGDHWTWQDEMFEKYVVGKEGEAPNPHKPVPLRDVPDCCAFEVAGIKMRKLHEEFGGWLCVFCNSVFKSEFGTSSNYAKSTIHSRLLAETLPELEAKLGAHNLLEFNLSLLSFNDKNTYLDITTKIGIANKVLYDRYGRTYFRGGSTAWLATAYNDNEGINVSLFGLDSSILSRSWDVVPIVCLSGDLEVLCEY